MEHTEAAETLAPERYLMGEMTPKDRDAFEEHFFGCAECADDVRAGAALAAGVRARKARPREQARPRMTWIPAAVAAVLAIIVGYQSGVVIPQMARQRDAARQQRDAALAPTVLHTPLVLSTGMSRGEGQENHVPAGEPFTIELNIDPENGVTGYTIDMVDARGAKHATYHVTAEQARQSVPLLPPGGRLPPGRYSLNVKPETTGRSSSVSFNVR